MKRSLLLFALSAFALAAQAEVYKWIDADGKTQYGDAPPKGAKATVVSGGVTVIPAMVVPPPAPKPAAPAGEDASRPAANVNNARNTAPVGTQADAAAASREEARAKAIERCKKNRGTDCENEVDAQMNGQPTAGYTQEYAPGVIPGWSQPPIRPSHRPQPVPPKPGQKPGPRPKQGAEETPTASMGRHAAQSSVAIKPMGLSDR